MNGNKRKLEKSDTRIQQSTPLRNSLRQKSSIANSFCRDEIVRLAPLLPPVLSMVDKRMKNQNKRKESNFVVDFSVDRLLKGRNAFHPRKKKLKTKKEKP
ncbi:hypothetical protein TNIN_63041 [Trichonephila inaurata madagascariensis]|uniref:Uncharacterized protein n=1 Tax=Trichonephila inaurata madagascariensis TaxID=2747483 RepID=A0A8X6YGD7_9ARAC|nr:hypothetical protein TNIN_63041 [Trichonephila inaurata madagascariensis]